MAAGAVIFLYLHGCLRADGLKALGAAYISLGAALFGIVLAGLAVVAAFFDREYVRALRAEGVLDLSLFAFWWVAAISVAALLTSLALTVVVYVGGSKPVVATAVASATFLFVSALLEALALVGSMMRHGLYRANIAEISTPPDAQQSRR